MSTWGGSHTRTCSVQAHVRFGSLADICSAKRHVRFTPNSDRESEILQKAMSALAPKADMCGATRDVRFGPKAELALLHLISSGSDPDEV
jgi:hypothetical protein